MSFLYRKVPWCHLMMSCAYVYLFMVPLSFMWYGGVSQIIVFFFLYFNLHTKVITRFFDIKSFSISKVFKCKWQRSLIGLAKTWYMILEQKNKNKYPKTKLVKVALYPLCSRAGISFCTIYSPQRRNWQDLQRIGRKKKS